MSLNNPLKFAKRELILLLAILAISAFTRLSGINFGFPDLYRPDEEYFANSVRGIDGGGWNPHFFYYPNFYMYFNLLVWRAYVAFNLLQGNFNPELGVNMFLNKTPYLLFYLGRLVSASFGIATVLLIYLMTRKFMGTGAAILASLFLSINSNHCLNSHFYKSDIVTGFFILCSLYALGLAMEIPRKKYLYWAGIWAGLATSSNYYGGFLVLPLCLGIIFFKKRHRLAWGEYFQGFLPYGPFIIMVLSFLFTSPYIFLDYHTFLKHMHRMLFSDRINLYNTLVAQHFTDYHFQTPVLYSIIFCWRYSMGTLLTVISIIATIRFLFTKNRTIFLWVIFTIFYLYMTSTGKAIFTRYYTPIVPLLCAFSGFLLTHWYNKITADRRWRSCLFRILTPFIILLLIYEPAKWTLKSNKILKQKDTRTEAREYMENNLLLHAKVASSLSYYYGKPPAQSLFTLVNFVPSTQGLKSAGVRYICWDSYFLFLYSPPPKDTNKEFLENKCELIAEFSPLAKGKQLKDLHPICDQLDAFYLPIANFDGIERPGPLIQLYKLKDPEEQESRKFNELNTTSDREDQKGLRATYYASSEFEGNKFIQIDPQIDFDWGTGSPLPQLQRDEFSVEWIGKLNCPVPTTYTFFLSSDDGSRLWIDNDLIIDYWGDHAAVDKSGSVTLSAGWHDIKVRYYERNFGASVKLSWQWDINKPKAIIPSENFKPN